ncbi:amidohydrolase family protein [Plantactinospora sp. WMMC1484]|uniref:amidohydrolase family protein n=1 Tax=Plantactinospora sp. WMMC1484 TaxID=3404122 RepID=UPI003BF49FEA
MTVVDAHQHLWDLELVDYPWLTAEYGPIFRTFTEADAEPVLAAAGVRHTVLVQSMDSYADTDHMLTVADRWSRVAAVVGWVPLDRPDEAAEALDRYTGDPRFVGVRHLIHEEADPDWLRRPAVQDGLALLAERGLSFDVVAVLPRHLEHLPWLAERHPTLRMVIDHLGKPPVAGRGWAPWADLLRAAAGSPTVHAKLSGLNTAAEWQSWTADDLRPYVDHALAVFGPDRLMYGGDWPVALLAGDYPKVWRETNRLLEPLGEADRARILGGTAVDFYRIPGV